MTNNRVITFNSKCFCLRLNVSLWRKKSCIWSPKIGHVSSVFVVFFYFFVQSFTCLGTAISNREINEPFSETVNRRPNPNGVFFSLIYVNISSISIIGAGGVTYLWSPSNSLTNSTSSTTAASPSNNTTYTLTVTDNLGCQASANIIVQLYSLPVSNAGTDGIVCENDTVQLNGSGGGGIYGVLLCLWIIQFLVLQMLFQILTHIFNWQLQIFMVA